MKSLIKIYFTFIITASILLLSCDKAENEKAEIHESKEQEHKEEGEHPEEAENTVELTSAQYQVAGIQLGKVEQKELSSVLNVNGVLDVPPQNLVTISAKMGGFVKKTDLLQGMRVKKGQLIAVLENQEYVQLQQDYLENKSRLEYLELEYQRQKELNEANVNSAKVLQQTTAEYKAVKARVNGLEEKLALINIYPRQLEDGNISRSVSLYSPIDGYVTVVNVNVGSFVNPTDVMFEIVDTKHMHVELMVFEKDVMKINEGQKVRYVLPNESGKESTATVYLIGRKIGEDKTVRVHAHMDKEDPKQLPGMYVKALIETGNNKVNALPEQAVVQSDGKDYVFIFKGKRKEGNEEMNDFQMIEIKTGVTDNGYVEVSFPDEIGVGSTNIVTKGAFSLLSQMKNAEGGEEGHAH